MKIKPTINRIHYYLRMDKKYIKTEASLFKKKNKKYLTSFYITISFFVHLKKKIKLTNTKIIKLNLKQKTTKQK